MNLKFGHRKRLMDLIHRLDCLGSFLEATHLLAHKKRLLELGFGSVWSLLGVKAEYAEKMELNEEEMAAFLKGLETLVGVEVWAEVQTPPPLPSLGMNDSCEPLLRLIFDEENTQRIMTVGVTRSSEA